MTTLQPAGEAMAALERVGALVARQAVEIERKNDLLRDIGEWIDRGQGGSTEELILMFQERKALRGAITKELPNG